MLHPFAFRGALLAAFLMAVPASAMMPPAPLSQAMVAVSGDYTMTLWRGDSCPLTLHESWAEGGAEVYAQAGIDAECLAKTFGAVGLAEPLQWTVFEGGGILLKAGTVELRFRPNYEQGRYVATLPPTAAGDQISIALERIKP
ncbi:hypothetical protein sos41_09180 [Alphaproteobacteria bacterium SO-S41]|nr:hypothetical protein sos41_09180 [Alphaproteobacteria bacterium SO-S41]